MMIVIMLCEVLACRLCLIASLIAFFCPSFSVAFAQLQSCGVYCVGLACIVHRVVSEASFPSSSSSAGFSL
jgi:hypothetical protein